MRLTRLLERATEPLRKRYRLSHFSRSPMGSAGWLVAAEVKFGGKVTQVARNKVSRLDPRTTGQIADGGMVGGDRMAHHGYAPKYSEYLRDFLGDSGALTLAEFGILKGSGLAIWCELFPEARVLGFDIDLNHTQANMPHLRKCGAFLRNQPELHEYDQFIDNTEFLSGVLGTDRVDICIDDGFHSNETILKTLQSIKPFLADRFVYFIEDNDQVHHEIRASYRQLSVESVGELTIVTN